MARHSVGVGFLAALALLVFFGYSSHPKVPDLRARVGALAEVNVAVRPVLSKRFPALAHRVFFKIDSARKWKSIVFHHSATTAGSAAAFDRYHRETLRDPDGIKYHFVIGNGTSTDNGAIEVTGRWRAQKDAAHLYRPIDAPDSIAICLVGNFEHSSPTKVQKIAAVKLAYVLMRRYNIPVSAVRTHREVDVGRTVCPGRHFPADVIRECLTVLSAAKSAN